ncbi:MAG: hypothetical protein K9N49_02105 [Candidatus Marinimicrobia bacterium]|nr:hypothetical protein [Candidatus Neomarinimicrobiota bacterium]
MKQRTWLVCTAVIPLLMGGCDGTPRSTEPSAPPPAQAEDREAESARLSVPVEDSAAAYQRLMAEGGQLLEADDQQAEAGVKFREAALLKPDDNEALVMAADAFIYVDDYAQAREMAEMALTNTPEDREVMRLNAQVLAYSDEHAAALELLERIAEKHGRDSALNSRMASIHIELGQDERAEACYEENIMNAPDDIMAYTEYAHYWLSKGARTSADQERIAYYQQSADYYQQAFEKAKPDDDFDDQPGQMYSVGTAYEEKWKFSQDEADKQKAIAAYRQFVEMKPDHPFALGAQEAIANLEAQGSME